MDIESIVPLDEESLLHSAKRKTGRSDFGGDDWLEPFRLLIKGIQEDAELNLMGRLMARSDLLMLLENRLLLTDIRKKHPEIAAEKITEPVFIVGLPRSGTSIVYEILSQDPAFRVPKFWEAWRPCPPPEAGTYDTDPRIARVDALVTQWSRVVPELEAMHEFRGNLPCECALLMAPTFRTSFLGSLQHTPSYNAWLARADPRPAYRFHRDLLQVLQWRYRRKHWLLKGPEHLPKLRYLFDEYPDARVIQTHRDPIKVNASAASLIGTLAWTRSDRPSDLAAYSDVTVAEGTAALLGAVMQQRDQGLIPNAHIYDVLYEDIVTDPIAVARKVYAYFKMELTDQAIGRMKQYAASKPQGKFGVHRYNVGDAEEISSARSLFRQYQERYGVPSEV